MTRETCSRLFPARPIRYFIAPFNRTNEHTASAAAKFGLRVLAARGIHLEEQLHQLEVREGEWYRYHHHRFYPESTFPHWSLSMEALERALDRCFGHSTAG